MPAYYRALQFWTGRAASLALLVLLPLAIGARPRLPPPPVAPGAGGVHIIAVLPNARLVQAPAWLHSNTPASDTSLVSQSASPDSVASGGMLTYTVIVTNATTAQHTFHVTDTLPAAVSYVTNTLPGFVYNLASSTLTATETLGGWQGSVAVTTTAPAYTEIGSTSNPSLCQQLPQLLPDCDDDAIQLGGVPFRYLGVDYSTITLSTNGFVIPGPADPRPGNVNQNLPDPTAPNDVIAPFWTDLDLNGGATNDPGRGDWFYGTQPCYDSTCLVVEWRDAQKKGAPASHYSFEVWIELYTERITFAYQSLSDPTNSATIGFENSNGALGASYLYNGVGSVPVSGTVLAINSRFQTAVLGYQVQVHAGLPGCSTLSNPIQLAGDGLTGHASALTAIFGPCVFLPAIQR